MHLTQDTSNTELFIQMMPSEIVELANIIFKYGDKDDYFKNYYDENNITYSLMCYRTHVLANTQRITAVQLQNAIDNNNRTELQEILSALFLEPIVELDLWFLDRALQLGYHAKDIINLHCEHKTIRYVWMFKKFFSKQYNIKGEDYV